MSVQRYTCLERNSRTAQRSRNLSLKDPFAPDWPSFFELKKVPLRALPARIRQIRIWQNFIFAKSEFEFGKNKI